MLRVTALLAACASLAAAAGIDPANLVHIAFAGADDAGYPNAMALSWQTMNSTATSSCKYGQSPSLSDAAVAQGSQSSYYSSWQHHAVTGALSPGQVYYYSCGDDAAGWSPVYNFTAPKGQAQGSVTMLQVGDMGVYNSEGVRMLLEEHAPSADMLLWSGDICYADDAFLHDPAGFGYEETYDVCQLWLQNITTYLPFMTAPGNHEAECHSPACLLDDHRKEALHNFSAYNARFRMPSDVSKPNPGTLNMWYSFNIGPVHVVAFNSETDYPDAPEDSYTGLPNGNFGDQMAWLEADLAFANSPAQRALRPWVISTTHRPLYTLDSCEDNGEPTGTSASLAKAVESLLYKYGVDVHFAGHVHAYERQHPVYQNKLVSGATTHIVSGAGGNTEDLSNLHDKPGAVWSAYHEDSAWGAGKVVASASQLSWTFYSATDGSVMDSVVLHK